MTGISVFKRSLIKLRWQVLSYGLGLGLMGAFIVYVYPSYSQQLDNFQLPDSMKALLGGADYGTGPGFVGGEFFSWVPPLLVIFGVMAGTSALAGEEEDGTLDLLLAQPISRSSIALAKLAAITVGAALIAALIYGGWLISVPFVKIDLSYTALLAATANIVPLIVFFAAFSTWAGAAFGRGPATIMAAVLGVVGFFVSYLSELVNAIRPLRSLSIFYYNGGTKAITDGVDPLHLLVMLALVALMVALTLRAFERREIGVSGGVPFLHWPNHKAADADDQAPTA